MIFDLLPFFPNTLLSTVSFPQWAKGICQIKENTSPLPAKQQSMCQAKESNNLLLFLYLRQAESLGGQKIDWTPSLLLTGGEKE
jgi:hypothetical protein